VVYKGSVASVLTAASGTKYEALAEARERVVARTFVPTGKVVIPKASQAESTSSKAAANRKK
jgi:hypothetical protein